MANLSDEDANEIYLYPKNLNICVFEPEAGKGFVFRITRGPQDLEQVIATSKPVGAKREDAIHFLVLILRTICERGLRQANSPSPASRYFPRSSTRASQGEVLSPAMIRRIENDLLAGRSAATYLY